MSENDRKVRCLTARLWNGRNIGEPVWVTPGQLQAELSTPQPRFFVEGGDVEGADDLTKIAGVTRADARALNVRGIFYYGQLLRGDRRDPAVDVAMASYFQHSKADEGRRRAAIRKFRELSAQHGTEGALDVMAGKLPAEPAKPRRGRPPKKTTGAG